MAFSTIQGSGGAPDSFVGTSGVDSITLIDSLGNFDLRAKDADDVVTILATDDLSTSDASARGGDGNDTFLTLNGVLAPLVFNNSFFNGNAGNDVLDFSDDILAGTTLLGGQGDDIITTGNAISSRFNGNIGDDTLTIDGISSNSSFYGGKDDDTIGNTQSVTNSLISGDDGDDTITAGAFSLEGSTLNGGDGDDLISAIAATSSVLIDGGDGIDALTGSGLADTIDGGAGNDLIVGGVSADTMTGGLGVNTFGIAGPAVGPPLTATDSGNLVSGVVDIITDFKTSGSASSRDVISGTAFVAGSAVGGVGAVGYATYALAAAAADSAGGNHIAAVGSGTSFTSYLFNGGAATTVDLSAALQLGSIGQYSSVALAQSTVVTGQIIA